MAGARQQRIGCGHGVGGQARQIVEEKRGAGRVSEAHFNTFSVEFGRSL